MENLPPVAELGITTVYLKCSTSERAILVFATSLVGMVGVNLQKALLAVDDTEILTRALRQAVGEEPAA
ncbi:hypothetical protein ACWGI8_27060 [Streptomyces sp. NPDC054841]